MLTLLVTALSLAMAEPHDRPCVLVVVGAPGTEEYGDEFRRWASLWRAAAEKATAEFLLIGEGAEGGTTDRERLRSALAEKGAAGSEAFWVVLIGHGTFDGREAKFNLRGPDLTDAELLDWVKPIRRPVAILNCASASGPFLSRLSGPGRIVVTATRSGDEQSFAHFGQYLAESVADPSADLDKDGQVSLLDLRVDVEHVEHALPRGPVVDHANPAPLSDPSRRPSHLPEATRPLMIGPCSGRSINAICSCRYRSSSRCR